MAYELTFIYNPPYSLCMVAWISGCWPNTHTTMDAIPTVLVIHRAQHLPPTMPSPWGFLD